MHTYNLRAKVIETCLSTQFGESQASRKHCLHKAMFGTQGTTDEVVFVLLHRHTYLNIHMTFPRPHRPRATSPSSPIHLVLAGLTSLPFLQDHTRATVSSLGMQQAREPSGPRKLDWVWIFLGSHEKEVLSLCCSCEVKPELETQVSTIRGPCLTTKLMKPRWGNRTGE